MVSLIIQPTETDKDKACIIYHNFFIRRCVVDTIRTFCKVCSICFVAYLLYIFILSNLTKEIMNNKTVDGGIVFLAFLLVVIEIGLVIAIGVVVSNAIRKLLSLHEEIVRIEGETIKQWL